MFGYTSSKAVILRRDIVHKLIGDKVIYTFKTEMEPVLTMKSGEEILVETNDCFFQQIESEEQVLMEVDFDHINPATGPIYVEEAEPGDLLKVEILKIDVADKGVAGVVPGEGILGDKAKKPIIRIIPIKDGYAHYKGLKLPIKPMVGVIGVAPGDEDGECPTETPWKHGGNMDTTDIAQGNTVYFPVRQKGALLALGDCHAIMGDGEICFTGLEVPASVKLRVSVIKDKKVTWPLIETKDSTMVVASGDDVDKAIYNATEETVELLSKALDMDFEETYLLTSIAVHMKISQVVDPRKTIRSEIPHAIITTEKLLEKL